jgi:hypothetical protein
MGGEEHSGPLRFGVGNHLGREKSVNVDFRPAAFFSPALSKTAAFIKSASQNTERFG